MSLPHFHIESFPGQLIWLFITGGMTYLFSKFLFIPLISSSINKRNSLLRSYIEETKQINIEVKNLVTQIESLSSKSSIESKAIIEEALSKSQIIMLQYIKENNDSFLKKIKEYDEYLISQNIKLSANVDFIIKEVRDKIIYFITRQNIS